MRREPVSVPGACDHRRAPSPLAATRRSSHSPSSSWTPVATCSRSSVRTASSNKRFEIAYGKAHGAVSMGMGSRALMARAEQQPYFVAAVTHSVGALVPVPGRRPGSDGRRRASRCGRRLGRHVRPRRSSRPGRRRSGRAGWSGRLTRRPVERPEACCASSEAPTSSSDRSRSRRRAPRRRLVRQRWLRASRRNSVRRSARGPGFAARRTVASTPSEILPSGSATIFVGMKLAGCRAFEVTPVPSSSSARSKANMICANLLWV